MSLPISFLFSLGLRLSLILGSLSMEQSTELALMLFGLFGVLILLVVSLLVVSLLVLVILAKKRE